MSLQVSPADPVVKHGIAVSQRLSRQFTTHALTASIGARAFSLLVLTISASAFIAIAGLNFVIDPYAQYAPEVLPPLVQTSRATKVRMLSGADVAPAGLVLGSSRVLKLEPDYLQQKFGHKFFNAGVNFGRPEDFLALLRFYQQQFHRLPQTVVLGLDVNAFSDANPADARLLASPELAPLIPDAIPWRDRFQRWHELLSWQQTKCSLQSVRKEWRQAAPAVPAESFRSDGLLVYHEREAKIRAGTYDFLRPLQENQQEYRQLFQGFDKLSTRRCELFRSCARLCAEHDVQLIVFLTPMHPDLADDLAATTYPRRRDELVEFLDEQARAGGFVFCDCSAIGSFAGDPRLFVDGIHPLETNTRRLIDELTRHCPPVSTYVVQ